MTICYKLAIAFAGRAAAHNLNQSTGLDEQSTFFAMTPRMGRSHCTTSTEWR